MLSQSLSFTATNPLNKSTSKQMFSFPRSPRKSIDAIRTEIYTHQMYELASSVSMTKLNQKKTPGFGIGSKLSNKDMRLEQRLMPGPGSHNLRSSFEANKSHRKGYTFGASNETYAKVYNKCLPEKKGWTDPGLYNINSFADNVKSGKKRIFFGEKIYEGTEKAELQSPGPG